MSLTRRSFVKKSAYSAAAVTVLGTGVGLTQEVSSAIEYEYLLECVSDPSDNPDYPGNWTPAPSNNNSAFGQSRMKAVDPSGPGGVAYLFVTVAGHGPTKGQRSSAFTVSGSSKAEFQHPRRNLSDDEYTFPREVAEVSSYSIATIDTASGVVTISPKNPTQKEEKDDKTQALVKVTPSFTVNGGGGYHDSGYGSVKVSIGILEFSTDDEDNLYYPEEVELAWGIKVVHRVKGSGGAWIGQSTL